MFGVRPSVGPSVTPTDRTRHAMAEAERASQCRRHSWPQVYRAIYLAKMEAELRTALGAVLRSHGLPPEKDGPLWEDDYDRFLDLRLTHLMEELKAVTT